MADCWMGRLTDVDEWRLHQLPSKSNARTLRGSAKSGIVSTTLPSEGDQIIETLISKDFRGLTFPRVDSSDRAYSWAGLLVSSRRGPDVGALRGQESDPSSVEALSAAAVFCFVYESCSISMETTTRHFLNECPGTNRVGTIAYTSYS